MISGNSARATVLLVNDEADALASLKQVVRDKPLNVVVASSIEDAFAVLAVQVVDIVICDDKLARFGEHGFLRRIATHYPQSARILLADRTSLDRAIQAINEERIFGFLEKPLDQEVLGRTIDEALRLRALNQATRAFVQAASRSRQNDVAVGGAPWRTRKTKEIEVELLKPRARQDLSTRECEVLGLLADGVTVAQIAGMLFISVHTVRNHLKAMYRKLGVHSQAELVAWFKHTGS